MTIFIAAPALITEAIGPLLCAARPEIFVPTAPSNRQTTVGSSGEETVVWILWGDTLLPQGVLSTITATVAVRLISVADKRLILAPTLPNRDVLVALEDGLDSLLAGLDVACCGGHYCSPSVSQDWLKSPATDPHQTSQDLLRSGLHRHSSTRPLSRREEEVALLAAAGLSNAEIGARLYIDVTTVKAHLQEVFRKTGVRRRSQIGLLLSG